MTSPSQRSSRAAHTGGRRRATLSLEAIVGTAIAMLDRDGIDKLTLRALAGELESGVASLYWYASGKDELMAVVADELLGRALAENEALAEAGRTTPDAFAEFPAPEPDPQTSEATAEALVEMRRLVLCLFVQMIEHQWLAAQLMAAGPDQPNSLMFWERIGQALQRTELHRAEQFHASLALVNYASGMGAEISSRGAADMDDAERHEEFEEQVAVWDGIDKEKFPFVHSVLGEFRAHDDRSEFIAGLHMLLSGLERRTWDPEG